MDDGNLLKAPSLGEKVRQNLIFIQLDKKLNNLMSCQLEN